MDLTPQDLLEEAIKLDKLFRGFARAKVVAEQMVEAEAVNADLTHRRDTLWEEIGTLTQTRTDLEREASEAKQAHDLALVTYQTAVDNHRRYADSRIGAYKDSIASWADKTTKAETEYTERLTTLQSQHESTLSLLEAERQRTVDAAQAELDRLTEQIAQAEATRRQALEVLQR